MLTVASERTRHVRARAMMTGTLEHHIHEARAPQASTAGRIAADVTPGFIDHVR